jgi:hypothetical protein
MHLGSRESRELHGADAPLGVQDVIADEPFKRAEMMTGHPLAALGPASAVLKVCFGGFGNRHLVRVGPEYAGPKLSFYIDAKGVGLALCLELAPLAITCRVGEVDGKGGAALAFRCFPDPLSD